MAQLIRVKNNTLVTKKWVGQTILPTEYYTIIISELDAWKEDALVFSAVASGDIIINTGQDVLDDILVPPLGWKWLLGDTLPMSDLGNKLAIHNSTKPVKPGKEFYLVWSGCGDDISVTPAIFNGGQLLQFDMTATTATKTIEMHFAPEFGDAYVHEAYVKCDGAGVGDIIHATVFSHPSTFQTSANLDLILDGDWLKPAPGGSGTGTHGFAATPVLIRRFKLKDGDWDYDTVSGLLPNLTGTGLYKISTVELAINRYINNIPIVGNSYGYTTLSSDETAQIPPGYFIKITVDNNSGTDFMVCAFIEVYREQTVTEVL